MTEPVKRFVVDRSRWARGEPLTFLLSHDGKSCCLGFVCLQRGMSENDIRHRGMPADAPCNQAVEDLLIYRHDFVSTNAAPVTAILNTKLTCSAARINDDCAIDDREREGQLSTLFAEHGYEMVFIDGGAS